MWLTSVAAGVFVIARSPDVKLLLAWLAKVFTGLPHDKVFSAPSGLDNISRKAPEDRPGDDSEASVARSALAAATKRAVRAKRVCATGG